MSMGDEMLQGTKVSILSAQGWFLGIANAIFREIFVENLTEMILSNDSRKLLRHVLT